MRGLLILSMAVISSVLSVTYIDRGINYMVSRNDLSGTYRLYDKVLTVDPTESKLSDIQPAGGYQLLQSMAMGNSKYYNEASGRKLEVITW